MVFDIFLLPFLYVKTQGVSPPVQKNIQKPMPFVGYWLKLDSRSQVGRVASILRVERMGEEARQVGFVLLSWKMLSCLLCPRFFLKNQQTRKIQKQTNLWKALSFKQNVLTFHSRSLFGARDLSSRGRIFRNRSRSTMIFGAGELLMKAIKARVVGWFI